MSVAEGLIRHRSRHSREQCLLGTSPVASWGDGIAAAPRMASCKNGP